ncbi:alpha-ketoacid dehydrogenase subunit beta [Streptomyces mirabilis]|uniref:alpha-ketoacid dehydrogenase subunit beta n=1 Tax=Streptomyces mirabilis TaxID=68239 RepID=UPI003636E789
MNELAVLDLVLEEELRRDERIVLLATSTSAHWQREFGPERIRTCPISEQAMTGMAVGAAMTGLRPVVDLNRASFAFLVMDQLVNHAARLHYMSDGGYQVPMVVTSATRGRQQLGPQNEQCPYGVFMQLPGFRVVVPGSAEDACGLLRTAVRDAGPTLFFVAPELARGVRLAAALATEPIPFGQAATLSSGSDVTLLAIGGAVKVGAEAAALLASQGVSCDLIDPRTLVPLDVDTIAQSVRRTGRLVFVDDGPRSGAPAQILSALHDVEGLAARLGGRVEFVCCPDVPVPSTPALEQHTWPLEQDVADAALRLLKADR